MRIPDWKYNHFIEQIRKTTNKSHENYIIGSLLHDSRLLNLKPLGQFYTKRKSGKYALIDLYYPQIKLAIEIDEIRHQNTIKADKLRETEIKKILGCKFFHIDISKGNINGQINKIKSKIISEQNKQNFNKWQKPKFLDVFSLKSKKKLTLFVKIRGRIKPEDLMKRQTGYWKIAEKKRKQIKEVIIIHDSVIITHFMKPTWNQKYKKSGFSAVEKTNSSLLGTTVNWKTRHTITYSDDLY